MTRAMKFYKENENKCGEVEKVTGKITKREFAEDGWTYTFFFYKGELAKVECYNRREIIEIYNK